MTSSSIPNSLITVLNIFLTFLGEVFRKREYSKDEGKCLREYGDSFIKDNYIFDNYVLDLADYISVEVAENEYPIYGNSKKEIRKSYNVSILVTLTDTSELDKISVLLGDMATELYPDRYNYGNRSLLLKSKVYMESLHSQKEQLYLQSNNRQTYTDSKQMYGYFPTGRK